MEVAMEGDIEQRWQRWREIERVEASVGSIALLLAFAFAIIGFFFLQLAI
jgi:hypothetical protein